MNTGILSLTLVGALWMFLQTLPPPFPREGVVKILENRYLVAWDAQFVKNLRSPMHEHRMDLAAFFLTGGRVDTISLDGTLREGQPFDAGRALFQPRGVIHLEEYKSENTRAIGLELKEFVTAKSAGIDDRLDPVRLDNATYRSVIDHERVRIIETTLRPGTAPVRHSHPGRFVMEPTACTGSKPPQSAVTRDGGMRAWWVDAETHIEDHTPVKGVCRRIEFEIKAAL